MQANNTVMKQPNALYLLVLVQMWECFSFYGMRVLLVLYMSSQLGFIDSKALGIYAVYTGLVELGALVGGIVADRLLGLRRAIFIGGWLIACGHITMAFQSNENYLFVGLSLIVIGSSLFSTNVSALLGLYYDEDDPRRDEGYTLFYVGINLGGLLAGLICGIVGEYYGWHYGFSLAAVGMIIGNALLIVFRHVLQGKGEAPLNVPKRQKIAIVPAIILSCTVISIGMSYATSMLDYLPWMSIICVGHVLQRLMKEGHVDIKKVVKLILYLGALALFYAAEEQIGSTILLFNERYVTGTFLGMELPATFPLTLNPLTVLIVGSLLTYVYRFANTTATKPQGVSKKMIGAIIAGAAAFAILAISCQNANSQLVSINEVVLSVFAISVAELFVGPAVYSYCSEIAPEEQKGAIMGLVPLGFSLASFIGGHMSQLMAIPEEDGSIALRIYGEGFGFIAILLLGTAAVLIVVPRLVQTLILSGLYLMTAKSCACLSCGNIHMNKAVHKTFCS